MHKKIKPNFFIVGAPKCGTTSLYQWLKAHPDIFMPENKEPKYFCTDLRKQENKNNSAHFFSIKSKKEYLELFSSSKDESAIGEASTYYLYSKTAPKLIKDFRPEAKIIIMLRDPVEQIISSYNYSVQKGHESAKSLKEALDLEEKRKNNPPQSLMPRSYLYTEKAKFSKYIKRYEKHFDKNQIKIILLDKIKNNPEGVYQEVLDFLNVSEANFKPDFTHENIGSKPRFHWVNQALKHPKSPVRKLAELVPKSLAKKVRNCINKVLLKEGRLNQEGKIKKKLRREFKSEVQKIKKYSDKDLAKLWGYNEAD
jgi:hypothetical protein